MPPTPEPTPTPTPVAATRPDYLPEQFWDAKAGAVDSDKFGAHYTDITAKAAKFAEIEAARSSLPQKPEDYKVEPKLPEGVKLPDGMKLGDHPLQKPVFAWAHAHGISPDVLGELNGLVVAAEIEAHNAEIARVAEETRKLGDKAADRRAAVTNWAKGLKDGGKISAAMHEELVATGATAAGVELIEKLMAMANGAVPGNTAPRDPTPPPKTHAERIWGSNAFQATPQARAS